MEVPAGQFTLSPDYKILVRLERNCVAFYDTATGQQQRQIYLERRAFGFCRFQPNDKLLALFGDEDHTTILILDIKSGKTLSILNHRGATRAVDPLAGGCLPDSFIEAVGDRKLTANVIESKRKYTFVNLIHCGFVQE